MKKITIKSIVLCLSLLALTLIFASCTSSDGTLKYQKVKDGYAVVGLDKNAGDDITIPDTYKGKSVVEIADNAFYGSKIKKITIPSTVASVGNQAFAYCERLEGVYISDINAYASISFASIESNPLYYAHKLYVGTNEVSDVTISAQSIGSYALSGCASITKVNLTSAVSIGNGAFSYCESLCEISLPDTLESIGATAFAHSTSLMEISIPESIDTISHSTFAYCTSLKSASLPKGILEIPERMFFNCEALESVNLPDTLLTIHDSAFRDCASLNNVTIPVKVTEILDSAYMGCSSLTSLSIAEGSKLRTIGKNGFRGCYSLVDLSLMNASSLTLIDDSAFQFCTNLKNVAIPSGVKTLGDHAFSGCDNLALNHIGGCGYIGNSENQRLILVKYIDEKMTALKVTSETRFICSGALERHPALNTVSIATDASTSEGVLGIGSSAFAFCPKLTSIQIGKSVKTIGDFAVMGCTSLNKIKYGGNSSSWKSVTRGTNWTYGAGTSTITFS